MTGQSADMSAWMVPVVAFVAAFRVERLLRRLRDLSSVSLGILALVGRVGVVGERWTFVVSFSSRIAGVVVPLSVAVG